VATYNQSALAPPGVKAWSMAVPDPFSPPNRRVAYKRRGRVGNTTLGWVS